MFPKGLFDLAKPELNLKPVSVIDLVSNQRVELKPNSDSKMASPIGIGMQFFQFLFFTFSLPMTSY